MRDRLIQLPDDQTMKLVAEEAQRTFADAQRMFGQQAAQNQVNRMKANGVFATGGEGGSPDPMEIKPGTTAELMPVMRKMFGLT
jgi:hypothetical protein